MLLLAACLLAFGVTTVVLRWPQLTASEEVNDLYRRYAGDDHLDVAFIRGFRVNDSVVVNVTTFQARDSIGWATLYGDFIKKPMTELEKRNLSEGIDVIVSWLGATEESPFGNGSAVGKKFWVASCLERELCIFEIENERQYHDIEKKYFKKLTK